jgi:hypothetical protein
VSVAVLLDNFVSASAKMEEEERQLQILRARDNKTVSLTLDPLLARLARDFVDNADLSSILMALFRVPSSTGVMISILLCLVRVCLVVVLVVMLPGTSDRQIGWGEGWTGQGD